MSDIDTMLAEVKRLDAEATQGPWRVEPDPGYECDECGERDEQSAIVRAPSGAGICVVLVGDREDADAALIAYYRTAAPALAAELERLRGKVEHGRNARAAMADRLFDALRELGEARGVLKCINSTAEACPICGGTRAMVDCGENSDGWSTQARVGHIRHSETCTLLATKGAER